MNNPECQLLSSSYFVAFIFVVVVYIIAFSCNNGYNKYLIINLRMSVYNGKALLDLMLDCEIINNPAFLSRIDDVVQ